MNGQKATRIWNPSKMERMLVLPAAQRKLPADKNAKVSFAVDTAGVMAGGKNEAFHMSG